jgi:hypothetical protein
MQKTLRMIFKNAAGKNVSINLPDPDSEITAMEVEAVMDSVISRNVFDTSGGDIESKVRAEVVARDVDVLADYEA